MSSAPQPTSAAPTPSGVASPQPTFRHGAHKSCDACKARKVKCPNVDYPAPCGNCVHLRYTRSYNAATNDSPLEDDALRYVDEPTPTCQAGKLSTTPPAAHFSTGAPVSAVAPTVPTLSGKDYCGL
ncbi:hypothetical protein Sste5346_009197 [Sporothrix stenoceras]|uniref:Zn(2)-C6 fungal-type domain-containing protein n=1 Tax=Sporothrix stenoceras TaxID=5173 RepID=A0ABR3YM83_9PEZI